jgi:hypothetical protein
MSIRTFLKSVCAFSILAVLAALNVCKVEAGESTVATRLGELRATNGDLSGDLGATLKLNGRVVFRTDGEPFLEIEKIYRLSDRDIVLFSSNMGGSGTLPSYAALILRERAQPKLLNHDKFGSSTGTFVPKLVGEVVEVDLGFENKQRKVARIEGDQLTVTFARTQNTAISRRDCDELYDQTLGDCGLQDRQHCNDAIWQISMASQREVHAMENTPGFNAKSFNRLCSRVCEARKKPKRADFGRLICGETN